MAGLSFGMADDERPLLSIESSKKWRPVIKVGGDQMNLVPSFSKVGGRLRLHVCSKSSQKSDKAH